MRKIPHTVWIVLVVFLLATNVAFIVTSRKQRINTEQEYDLLTDSIAASEQATLEDFIPRPGTIGLLIRELHLTQEQQERFRQFHRAFNR